MQYYAIKFSISPCTETSQDILSALLGDIDFESFQTTDEGLIAYIQQDAFNEENLNEVINNFFIPNVNISYIKETAENKNWNEQWEQNSFEPIIINDLCCIHSSWHENTPTLRFDIVINPKMAFGSGTHDTTYQLTELLLNTDFSGQTTLDMGCGTCVLGIAMAKRGAKQVIAIDIDENSVDNAKENCGLNNIDNIEVIHGDASSIPSSTSFNYIVANIHKNIIINDMQTYAEHLTEGGRLLVSGFYSEDVKDVEKSANSYGLKKILQQSKNNWTVVCFEKEK